jgi:hypothetical protein
MKPIVDVVIPAWNNMTLTGTCATKAAAFAEWPFLITVIDDGSAPAFPPSGPYRTWRNDRNLGFTATANRGLSETDAEYVCILNNDAMAYPGWLRKMMAHMLRHEDLGMLIPTQLLPSVRTQALYNDGSVRLEFVSYAPMFCALLSRAAINAVGVLDPKVGRDGLTDLDYCIRLGDAGFKVGIARDVYFDHIGRQSISKLPEWATGEYQRVNYQEKGPLVAKWGLKRVNRLMAESMRPSYQETED